MKKLIGIMLFFVILISISFCGKEAATTGAAANRTNSISGHGTENPDLDIGENQSELTNILNNTCHRQGSEEGVANGPIEDESAIDFSSEVYIADNSYDIPNNVSRQFRSQLIPDEESIEQSRKMNVLVELHATTLLAATINLGIIRTFVDQTTYTLLTQGLNLNDCNSLLLSLDESSVDDIINNTGCNINCNCNNISENYDISSYTLNSYTPNSATEDSINVYNPSVRAIYSLGFDYANLALDLEENRICHYIKALILFNSIYDSEYIASLGVTQNKYFLYFAMVLSGLGMFDKSNEILITHFFPENKIQEESQNGTEPSADNYIIFKCKAARLIICNDG